MLGDEEIGEEDHEDPDREVDEERFVAEVYALLMGRRRRGATGRPEWHSEKIYAELLAGEGIDPAWPGFEGPPEDSEADSD